MIEIVVKTALNNLVLVQFDCDDIDLQRRACRIVNDHGLSARTAWYRKNTAYAMPSQLKRVDANEFVNVL